MPDTKITALTAITTVDPANDVLPIVDVSDTSMAASGTTKKITTNQLLGASGTATLASATITGDLTVDTNTLKVDSANNRVIVGHTSGSSAFQVTNAGAAGLEIQPTGFSSAPLILSYNRSAPAYTQLTLDGSTIVHALSGSTAMTLNSTGLGVGVSPTEKLTINNTSGAVTGGIRVYANDQSIARIAVQNINGQAWHLVAGNPGASNQGFGIYDYTNSATRMYFDTSGNVGIGVTPSAWATLRGLQNGRANLVGYVSNSEGAWLTNNAFYDGSWKYQTSAQASHYQQLSGVHSWSIAGTGTAGNAITFTQAMTLDASGNFGIGVTSPAAKLHVEGSGPQARFSVATAVDARHEYYRNGIREGLLYWDANLIGLYATQSSGELVLASANTIRVRINSAGDTISNVTATPPTLSTNRQMVFNLTSDTNLRISVRGSDGVTRTTNLTLA